MKCFIVSIIRFTFEKFLMSVSFGNSSVMKKNGVLWIILLLFGISTSAHAQLKKAVEDIFSAVEDSLKTINTNKPDSDSVRFFKMGQQLEEAKSNEMSLRMELEQLKLVSYASDSLKLVKQRAKIDSLRSITSGVPVVVEGDTLFTLYAKRGGLSPHDRAESFTQNILRLGKRYKMNPDSVYIEPSDNVTDIMYDGKVIASVTDLDALWQSTTREQLAQDYRKIIVHELQQLKEEHSLFQLAKRIFFFVLVLVIQYLLYRATTYLYRRLKKKIITLKDTKLKPISFHDYELLDTDKEVKFLTFFANMGRYLIVLLQLLVTIPILFSIFPQTEHIARQIFSYLWFPVKSILRGMGDYIPNLFTIFVIYFVVRYVIKGLRYLTNEIAIGKLKLSGFYPDWAEPTFHIIRFLLYAFMIAMIYPYLPGSNSGVFQGISVFVGLIVSLGSSTVIGNIIAGMVITYMRAFKLGDRIKLNDITGNVIEKTPLVTRVKTPKNELVTIPNSFVMSSHTINYSESARELGLIIHSEVSIGYDAPWRKVHQLLIDAAKATPGVSTEPEPFVLETSLSDFYPVYQINAYIKEADKLPRIYSALFQNIQDKFAAADVEIMSPHYIATRDGNESTIPKTEQ